MKSPDVLLNGPLQQNMKIAIVIPDGLSATLFCTGMIRAARATDGCEIAVISDAAEWEAEIERLGAKSISVPMYRFFGPLRDFAYVGALTRIFREEQFDAVVNFSTKPNVYGAIVGLT